MSKAMKTSVVLRAYVYIYCCRLLRVLFNGRNLSIIQMCVIELLINTPIPWTFVNSAESSGAQDYGQNSMLFFVLPRSKYRVM